MLKVPKGKLPADADLVVTLGFKQGIGFYLFDEQRWVVSDPQQHHARGTKKEKAASCGRCGHSQDVAWPPRSPRTG